MLEDYLRIDRTDFLTATVDVDGCIRLVIPAFITLALKNGGPRGIVRGGRIPLPNQRR